jgi:hypothetical protein
VTDLQRRFRDAARGYLVYGVVYYVGGLYLLWHGVGVMGSMEGRRLGTLAFWALAGLVPMLGIPYLTYTRHAWFERWVFSRRDFTRVVALFLTFRAYKIGQVITHHHGASVPAPGGGSIPFQVGAAVFFVITVGALIVVVRAAWAAERSEPPERAGVSPGARDFK